MIRCGHCKGQHETVGDVRVCAVREGALPVGNIAASLGIVTIADKVTVPMPKPELPNVAHARYAIQDSEAVGGAWKFYQIDRPQEGRWIGYTFVKVQAGDDVWSVKTRMLREEIIAAILRVGPEKAAKDYGHQIGACALCGRTLTNPDSIERGIGPICAEGMGW